MTSPQNSFIDFLKLTISQKEVSLVIAQDEKELKSFQKILNTNNFNEAKDVNQIMERVKQPAKTYFIVTPNLPKDAYDFLIQYPTGQVEIFNPASMKFDIMYPNYQNSVVIFIITKENLASLERQGFNIKMGAGLAYQN